MSKRWMPFSFAAGALVLASCSTIPDAPLARDSAPPAEVFITQFETNRPSPSPPSAALEGVPATPVLTNPPVELTTAPPIPQPPLTNARPALTSPKPTGAWVSLDVCAELAGWGKPERIRNTGAWTYQLKGAQNVLEVTAGRRTALWNGLNVELGFPPALTNGQASLHHLDVAKTLIPLTQPATLLLKTNRVVVIDPGHGGENYGAKSVVANRYEKELALDWAFRLERLLKAAGWRVYLTRTTDVDVPLADRVSFADSVQADLFLSLHFNSTDQPQSRAEQAGVETYCLTPMGIASTVTRRFEDEAGRAYPNNAFDSENLLYAERVHRAIVDATQRRDRGLRRARFMGVLRGQNRPAVLVEGGFLTDPTEARLIGDPNFRQKLANAVARALTPDPAVSSAQQVRVEPTVSERP